MEYRDMSCMGLNVSDIYLGTMPFGHGAVDMPRL
jgi:aryl-alcohol dehydrogenase-like predicted oxidoreductase